MPTVLTPLPASRSVSSPAIDTESVRSQRSSGWITGISPNSSACSAAATFSPSAAYHACGTPDPVAVDESDDVEVPAVLVVHPVSDPVSMATVSASAATVRH